MPHSLGYFKVRWIFRSLQVYPKEKHTILQHGLSASLLPVAMPFVTSSFLLLVVMPGAASNFLPLLEEHFFLAKLGCAQFHHVFLDRGKKTPAGSLLP